MGNACELPFKDNTFDHASITLALHEKRVEDRITIIAEMKRVVRKNGHLIFVDYMTPLSNTPYAFLSRSLEYMAGRDHHQFFQSYIQHGGLKHLLDDNDLSPEKEDRVGPLLAIKTLNRK